MPSPLKLDRRTVLKGLAGVTLSLPLLEAMGKEVAEKTPRRFCAMYTANGMSLPNPNHKIDEWSWFPKAEGKDFEFGKSTEPLRGLPPLIFVSQGRGEKGRCLLSVRVIDSTRTFRAQFQEL